MLEYTPENCEKLAEKIVDSMEFEDMVQYIFDDVYSAMLDDEELFRVNVEIHSEE